MDKRTEIILNKIGDYFPTELKYIEEFGNCIFGDRIIIFDGLWSLNIHTPNESYVYNDIQGLVKRKHLWTEAKEHLRELLKINFI